MTTQTNRTGVRHSIECNCILSQHSTRKDPPFFHFLAFSVVEGDRVIPKTVQCPNCGILHRVTDVTRSTILVGKEDSKLLLSVEDIKSSLPQGLVKILDQYDIETTQWEQAQFILDNERWGDYIMLVTETVGDTKQGKYVRILGKELFRVETFEVQV